ncbi:MAG: four-carbon acid sugar kinase family protein [Eubacteriales bacterium]|nr:four-carbon acid sugar kinase family protein [Eubacteriales bacterium]
MEQGLIFGCIADDFTGGSDAASFLAAGGMNTILYSGIPSPGFRLPEDCEAVVIALKSRTQETSVAVADSLGAVRWLQEQGATHFYIKYCSTFDSTPSGNIGPVVDAALEFLDVPCTLLCPALPANGRTVKDGILYVNGVPLAESPMKDHPLTPMWESRISKLMEPQSKYPAMELPSQLLRGRRQDMMDVISDFSKGQEHCYLIPDYTVDTDAEVIADAFGSFKVLSGGSGLLTALARRLKKGGAPQTVSTRTSGPAVILAGSCSVATNAQTNYYLSHGGAAVRLEDAQILNGRQTPDALWAQARTLDTDAPLIYAWESSEGLKAKRNAEGKALSALIEKTLAETAALAAADGVRRIIVAGGETSGAVTRRLGYRTFRIGQSIAPGVPILIPLEQPDVRLVLKSGNFGQEDFFSRALTMTKEL